MSPQAAGLVSARRFNHIGLVVANQARAEEFYAGVLGLPRHAHMDSWFWLNSDTTIHLIEIPEAREEPSIYHEVNHAAIEVETLEHPKNALLSRGRSLFQMDFEGNTRDVTDAADELTFGIGTLFTADEDGNLIEFVQPGRGLFTANNVVIHEAARTGLDKRSLPFGLINHVCLIVKDAASAQGLWSDSLRLPRDPRDPDGDWFTLGDAVSIHTAPAPEAATDPNFYRRNHFAVEVPSTADALAFMLDRRQPVTRVENVVNAQGDVSCAFPVVASAPEVLNSERPSFFVADPDGNLIEFGQRGQGEL